MLFPLHSPCQLLLDSVDENVKCLTSNRERTVFAVLFEDQLIICLARPLIKVAAVRRSSNCLNEKGKSKFCLWKPDSTVICVVTETGYILFYETQFQTGLNSYVLQSEIALRASSEESLFHKRLPSVRLRLSIVVKLPTPCAVMVPLREELYVYLKDGWIRRLSWNGSTQDNQSVALNKIPFTYDQLQSRTEFIDDHVFICDVSYSPLLGGFAIVLSNGKAGILVSQTAKAAAIGVLGVWAPDLTNACCVTVNHKWRLVHFGCKSGNVLAYQIDEPTGSLQFVLKLELSLKESPDILARLGSVMQMVWSPFGSCLAVSWEGGCLAVWSVFGSLIWCSLDDNSNLLSERLFVKTLDWSAEGYQLWVGCSASQSQNGSLCDATAPAGVWVISFVRSATVNNPVMVSEDRIVLLSDDAVHLSPLHFDPGASALHSHWNVIKVPSSYMANNWPLRYAALDSQGAHLCVAGTHGIAQCAMVNQRWKLFGNENQESEVVVYGGLGWWRDFIVAPVFNVSKRQDEIRWYPKQCKLENSFATIVTIENQVLLMSIREDVLVTLDISGRVQLMGMQTLESSNPTLRTSILAEIVISEIVAHPACVITLQLTALSQDFASGQFCPGADTLLLNISGRLIMLHPPAESRLDERSPKNQQLNTPMLIASHVEQFWFFPQCESSKPHLSQALWIHCGNRGMKVWMPLFPKDTDGIQTFLSKRIMLPFELDIYPIVVHGFQCVATGVECLSRAYHLDTERKVLKLSLERSSEVFLHQILKHLLKRNLGKYALQIAGSCRYLHYFSHVLELLLHGVLEEEATSNEAIPDPLLPRVVAFIQEFPEHLEVAAHCARKTEMALWTHLFKIVGNPKDLFEVCLREGRLHTAAAYLIVLQNMESGEASRDHAMLLAEAALQKQEWLIVREVMRLLTLIDPADIESPPRTPFFLKQTATAQHRMSVVSGFEYEQATDSLVFQMHGLARQRNASVTSPREGSPTELEALARKTSVPLSSAEKKTTLTKAPSTEQKTPNAAATVSTQYRHSARRSDEGGYSMQTYFELILAEHARHLLAAGRLFHLGSFSAHLDFHLVLWLTKERNRSARVQNYVSALMQLHADFNWPYPLLKQTVVDYLTAKSVLLTPTKEHAKPLHVITRRESSVDSGIRTQQHNGAAVKAISKTRRLLMQQPNHRPQELSLAPKTVDARLVPAKQQGSGGSVTATETDSVLGSSIFEEDGSLDVDWDDIEQLCTEMVAKGPEQAEVQLRFFQQILLEAGCLEWSLLLCVVLRDLVGLARAVNVSTVQNSPVDVLQRLKEGVVSLEAWADEHCMGYKPLLHAVHGHVSSLEKSVSTSPSAQQPKKSLGHSSSDTTVAPAAARSGGGVVAVPYKEAKAPKHSLPNDQPPPQPPPPVAHAAASATVENSQTPMQEDRLLRHAVVQPKVTVDQGYAAVNNGRVDHAAFTSTNSNEVHLVNPNDSPQGSGCVLM